MNLPVEYWLQTPYFIPCDKLTVEINLLGGDDGDSMVHSGALHPINQTPLPATWLELQDLIEDGVAFIFIFMVSS